MFTQKIVLLNLAETGGLIEAAAKIPQRQRITISVPQHDIDGAATVRYCDQQGLKYSIGIEFLSGTKSKKPRWT